MAMDWDTASEVAVCLNRPGYQKTGTRIVTRLREHKIFSELMYFSKPDKDHIEAVTVDSKHANRWGLYVNNCNAVEARKLLSVDISKDLQFKLTPDPTKQPATKTPK
jgi:hypothetical protein